MSRQQLTAALGSADLDVWSIRIIQSSTAVRIEVHLNGTNVIITYESAMEVGAHPIPYQHDSTGADYHQLVRARHTDTWTRSDGTWKHLRAETAAVQPPHSDGVQTARPASRHENDHGSVELVQMPFEPTDQPSSFCQGFAICDQHGNSRAPSDRATSRSARRRTRRRGRRSPPLPSITHLPVEGGRRHCRRG